MYNPRRKMKIRFHYYIVKLLSKVFWELYLRYKDDYIDIYIENSDIYDNKGGE